MRRPRRTSSHLHHCNRGVAVRPRRDEQRVVDGLESVQIEEQQGDLPTLARGERRYLIEVVTTGTWRFAAAPSGKPRRQWRLRARASSGGQARGEFRSTRWSRGRPMATHPNSRPEPFRPPPAHRVCRRPRLRKHRATRRPCRARATDGHRRRHAERRSETHA
jgi:hypothetical protein